VIEAALGAQRLDQPLEGQLLVGVGVEGPPPGALQELAEARIASCSLSVVPTT
jgi:hypothetical protein